MLLSPAFQAVSRGWRDVRHPTGGVTYLSIASDIKAIDRDYQHFFRVSVAAVAGVFTAAANSV
jgi:hypothetical protein